MARIRSIKPDFWTDEKIVELDAITRLFFIGSWNFADDNGNLQRSAKKLKMQILPADAADGEMLIQSLIAHGLFTEYEVNGEKFLHINGFHKHQVINRPSKTGLPKPEEGVITQPLTEPSRTEVEVEVEVEINPLSVATSGGEEQRQLGEKPETRPTTKPGMTPVPEDFTPTAVETATAKAKGLDLKHEVAKFIAHYQANGELRANWHAQFCKWLLEAQQIQADREKRNHGGNARASPPGTAQRDAGRQAAARSIFPNATPVGDQANDGTSTIDAEYSRLE